MSTLSDVKAVSLRALEPIEQKLEGKYRPCKTKIPPRYMSVINHVQALISEATDPMNLVGVLLCPHTNQLLTHSAEPDVPWLGALHITVRPNFGADTHCTIRTHCIIHSPYCTIATSHAYATLTTKAPRSPF